MEDLVPCKVPPQKSAYKDGSYESKAKCRGIAHGVDMIDQSKQGRFKGEKES